MIDEGLIIKRVREGDTNAFSELVTAYKKLIFSLCLRMIGDRDEAEDAAQEAFIKIYRGLGTYNGESKFSTWAMRIASNVCIDMLRKKKAQTVPIEDYEVSDDLSPERKFLAAEMKEDIEKAVKNLPEKYRVMIIYYHFMNLSYQEISNMIGEPMTIVKNRMYRARLMLKNMLYKEREGYDGMHRNIRIYNEIS